MSFSQDVRSSGHFQEQFGRLRRRINKAELPPDDLETLQGHVNDVRTQVDFLESLHIEDNQHTNPIGPNDFVFEPDATEVKMYNTFTDLYTYKLQDRVGIATFTDITLSDNDYNIIEIGDGAASRSTVTASTYHYEGWKKHNGVSDFIAIPSVTSLANLPQFSVACWFRTIKNRSPIVGNPQYGAEGEGFMVCKGGWLSGAVGQQLSYGIWHSDANRIRAGFEETDNTDHIASDPFTIEMNDGKWHHACVTYDGVTVRLYIEGVQTATHATTATPEVNTQDLTFGRQSLQGPNNSPLYFEGDLDQIYIWNNDLTSGEVAALYSSGTVPQPTAIVKQHSFGGAGDGKTNRKCFFAIPDDSPTLDWNWNVAFHPPQLKAMNSIALNIGEDSNQFLYYDNFATDYDFISQNFSYGFWIYPTDLSSGSTDRVVALRWVDGDNNFGICIDNSDSKLFMSVEKAGVKTNRQYDTPLVEDEWFYVNTTWVNSGPTFSIKVNDNADISSSKELDIDSTPDETHLFMGSYPGALDDESFNGFLCFPHWYKHSTVLTSGERTSLYNYGTKTSTTEPGILGFMQLG